MTVNPKSLANLRPPKKGEPSRNPAGRPPGKPWHTILAELEEEKKIALRDAAYACAMRGDASAREWIVKHSREGASMGSVDVDIQTREFTFTISRPSDDDAEREDDDALEGELVEDLPELVEEEMAGALPPTPVVSPIDVPVVLMPSIKPVVKAARKRSSKYLSPSDEYRHAMTAAALIDDVGERHEAERAADRVFQAANRAAQAARVAAEVAEKAAEAARATKQDRYLDTHGWV